MKKTNYVKKPTYQQIYKMERVLDLAIDPIFWTLDDDSEDPEDRLYYESFKAVRNIREYMANKAREQGKGYSC